MGLIKSAVVLGTGGYIIKKATEAHQERQEKKRVHQQQSQDAFSQSPQPPHTQQSQHPQPQPWQPYHDQPREMGSSQQIPGQQALYQQQRQIAPTEGLYSAHQSWWNGTCVGQCSAASGQQYGRDEKAKAPPAYGA